MNTVPCSVQSLNRRTEKNVSQCLTDSSCHKQQQHRDLCTSWLQTRFTWMKKTERKSQLEQNSTLAATVPSQCCRFVQQGVEKVIFSHYPETKYTQKEIQLNVRKKPVLNLVGADSCKSTKLQHFSSNMKDL